jgi:putative endonuclease
MLPDRTVFGRDCEDLAARFLEEAGLRVLARNWRAGRNEVDLVALEGETLVFVEVKGRRGDSHGSPGDAVHPRKQARILAAALAYLAAHPGGRRAVRFDAVLVRRDGGGRWEVEHLRDAFGLSGGGG